MARLLPPIPVLVAAAAVAAGLVLALRPPAGLSAADAGAAGLIVGTIGLWATGAVPEALTALGFFTLAMLMRVAPAEVIFSGFASSALWLIVSGLVLGAAIRQSGLGGRVAARMAAITGDSHARALAGVVVFGVALAFLMPSAMGRVMLMLPILGGIADRLGHPRDSRAHRSLVLGGVLGTALPSTAILPANIPNNVLAALTETVTGTPVAFSTYLLANFPVMGALKAALVFAALWLFARDGGAFRRSTEHPAAVPLSGPERRLAVLLAVALLLWMTDGVHRIAPAWIGMAAATLCLLPRIGVLPAKTLQSLNPEPVFHVAGIIGLGALAAHAELGRRLAEAALTAAGLTPGHALINFAVLGTLSTLLGLVTTLPGVPAVLTPLTAQLADVTGLTPLAVLFSQVVGFSTLILPYQSPPLVAAVQTDAVRRRDMAGLTLITAAASIVLLWPLHLLWLSVLGVF